MPTFTCGTMSCSTQASINYAHIIWLTINSLFLLDTFIILNFFSFYITLYTIFETHENWIWCPSFLHVHGGRPFFLVHLPALSHRRGSGSKIEYVKFASITFLFSYLVSSRVNALSEPSCFKSLHVQASAAHSLSNDSLRVHSHHRIY